MRLSWYGDGPATIIPSTAIGRRSAEIRRNPFGFPLRKWARSGHSDRAGLPSRLSVIQTAAKGREPLKSFGELRKLRPGRKLVPRRAATASPRWQHNPEPAPD